MIGLVRRRSRWLAAVVASLGLLGVALRAAAATDPAPVVLRLPQIVVEAPDSLARTAARIRAFDRARLLPAMQLVGLEDAGGPIRVLLAEEGSPLARSAPPWSSGYATGPDGTVVVMPDRVPAYPDRSLEILLQHEITHVFVARAAGGRPVPRWFNEGLAMTASRAWGFEDRAQATLGLVRGGDVSLAQVEASFRGGTAQARAAYALSQGFVREVLAAGGPGAAAEILAGLRAGAPFDDVFERVMGRDLRSFEVAVWKRYTFWHRWVPIVAGSGTLWLGITLLALVAFWRRRRKTAEKMSRWEAEEAALEAAFAGAAGRSEREPVVAPPSGEPTEGGRSGGEWIH